MFWYAVSFLVEFARRNYSTTPLFQFRSLPKASRRVQPSSRFLHADQVPHRLKGFLDILTCGSDAAPLGEQLIPISFLAEGADDHLQSPCSLMAFLMIDTPTPRRASTPQIPYLSPHYYHCRKYIFSVTHQVQRRKRLASISLLLSKTLSCDWSFRFEAWRCIAAACCSA